MVLYLGETLRITAVAVDPDTNRPLDPPPASALVDFWEPGLDPVESLDDRGTPTFSDIAMTYNSTEQRFELFQDTTGWPVKGEWTYRVRVVDTYTNFEFGSFVMRL